MALVAFPEMRESVSGHLGFLVLTSLTSLLDRGVLRLEEDLDDGRSRLMRVPSGALPSRGDWVSPLCGEIRS